MTNDEWAYFLFRTFPDPAAVVQLWQDRNGTAEFV